MPQPIAICIEDLDPPAPSRRYRCCVAISGAEPGLGLDARAQSLWKRRQGLVCELWVTQDERLALLRPQGAPAVTVRRAGRSLEVPFDKPVLLLDQDQLELDGRRVRIHVHGQAAVITPPSWLAVEEPHTSRFGAVARTAAAAAMAGAIACRPHPPKPMPPTEFEDQAAPPVEEPVVPEAGNPETVPEAGQEPDPAQSIPELEEQDLTLEAGGEQQASEGQAAQPNAPDAAPDAVPIEVIATPPRVAPNPPRPPPQPEEASGEAEAGAAPTDPGSTEEAR